MLYNFVLFLHILGSVVMFVAVGITLLAMISMLHSVKTEGVRTWSSIAVRLDGLLPFSVILILLPGLYLVISRWGWGKEWVDFSLAVLITLAVAIILGFIVSKILLSRVSSTVSTTDIISKNL